ncbi:hypothetical protein Ahy_B08g089552 isoform C [Arachis hypogaea]|uniref:CCDC93 N-terminal domain-containing protein n=1 Tax=Arachis hypogaea TaxID=3818 RepID=A0A444XY88_ARAHY|nr:hypothetical protein Ahy_B08g089552 isoform C [Arachis hypogaea]
MKADKNSPSRHSLAAPARVERSSMEDNEDSSTLHQILDLFFSAGYVEAVNSDAPPSHKIAHGLSWCFASLDASYSTITRVSLSNLATA